MYTREECIYFVIGWNVVPMFVMSAWLIVLYKSSLSLLIFYLVILNIIDNDVLKSPTTDICTHRNEYTKCISAYSGILFSLKKEEILTCAIT